MIVLNNTKFLQCFFYFKKKESEDDEREREKEYRLQSIAQLKQQEPWNISHAVRFVTYIGVGFTAYNIAPQFFNYIGLVL